MVISRYTTREVEHKILSMVKLYTRDAFDHKLNVTGDTT